MNKRTRTALEGSIAKWEGVVEGTTRDDGSDDCPLCQEFIERTGVCYECPVDLAVGPGCLGTPYDMWSEVEPPWHNGRYKHTPLSLAYATAELVFLKSLLPKPRKPRTPK